MEFRIGQSEVGPNPEGGWAKHFFYRMEDDSKFIAFWELHDTPGVDAGFETNLSKAAGLPDHINHISFDVKDETELQMRKKQWMDAARMCSKSTTTGVIPFIPKIRTTIWWSFA